MTDLFSHFDLSPPTTFVADDEPPPPPITFNIGEPPPPASDDPVCDVCGVPIEWAGRGRKPKFCLDHRKTRTRGPARVRIEASTDDADQKRLQWITDELTRGAGELAGAIVHAAPVTAVTVAHQSPDAVKALVRVGEQYPKFLDGLEAIAKVSPFATIGKFAAAILLALSVDLGRLKPYGVAAEILGVAAAAQEAGWHDPDEPQQQRVDNGGPLTIVDRTIPPPPAFKGF